MPDSRADNDLDRARSTLKALLVDSSHAVENIERFQKACPIDYEDDKCELVPECYLDQPLPRATEIVEGIERLVRGGVAFMLKDGKLLSTAIGAYARDESSGISKALPPVERWKRFSVTDIFDITKGDFDSLSALDPGTFMTVSRVVTDNGVTGYYDRPDEADVYSAGTLTVSTLGGDTFVQMDDFIATDNVLILAPLEHMPMAVRFFAALMLNQQTWRYSYGRQCYLEKFQSIQLWLPVTKDGSLDESYMRAVVEDSEYWKVIRTQFEAQQEALL